MTARVRSTWRSLLFTLALCLISVPSAFGEPAPPSDECQSPRDAMLQVLYYSQPLHQDLKRAALCIDTGDLSENPELALQVKRVLDLKKLYVEITEIPGEPDYKDEETGEHEYAFFPRLFPELRVTMSESGWNFSPDLARVAPSLYKALVPFDVDPYLSDLPSWMRAELFGVYLWQLIACLFLGLLALALQRLTLVFLGFLFRRFKANWIQEGLKAVARPIGAILAAAVFSLLLPLVHFPVQLHVVLMLAAQLVAAFGMVWLGFNSADVVSIYMQRKADLTESKLDDQLVPLVRSFLKVVIASFGTIFILQNLNVDVGSLLAGLGIGGLAFALAAKDTIANLFGSLTIFVDKPFQVGDLVSIGSDVEGAVEEVGFRTTRVRTSEKTLLTVPNGLVTNSIIENLSARPSRRYRTVLGLTYDTTADQITAFCQGVENLIESLPNVVHDNKTVEFTGFGDSGLEILVNCFMDTEDYALAMRTQHNINLAILQLAESLSIGFAFPTQTLHVESCTPPQALPSSQPQTSKALNEIAASYSTNGTDFAGLSQRTKD